MFSEINFPGRVKMIGKADKEILFSNFTYDPSVYYFFYIGEAKSHYINSFLQETLQEKMKGREVQFVSIISDIFSQYDYPNVLVINPFVANSENHYTVKKTEPITAIRNRIGTPEFMTAVSKNSTVLDCVKQILKNQDELYIYLFESILEMSLDQIQGVTLIGPDKDLATASNNKISQYQDVNGIAPLASHRFCDDVATLLQITRSLRDEWNDGIFISCAYSAAGSNSIVTHSQEELKSWSVGKEGTFLISRFIPHILDPTVLAVVANENDVYIAGVADQIIENGNRFVGSTYPSVATDQQKEKLHQYTQLIGQMLGRQGYRGIFGCDYIISNNGEIYFIEINGRKQGTTLEFCYSLEQALPKGSPMLPELEYYAVTENRFPDNSLELSPISSVCHWGTYNYKVHTQKTTTGFIPHNTHERESFRKIATGALSKDFVILEHVGSHCTVLPGTFLARVVSVAASKVQMEEGLRQSVELIKQTIDEA